MNIVIITAIIFSFLNVINAINNNYGNRIRNTTLRLFVLNDKKNIKLFKQINKFYQTCYNKSIAYIGQGMMEYNELTEEERTIIETIISLCY